MTILREPPKTGIETHDTADDGSFFIATSREGIQAVRAGARGYAGAEAMVSPICPLIVLNFRLAELRLVEGTVLSDTGGALEGVPVRIRYIDRFLQMQMDDGADDITDANGAFTLLAAGDGGGRFALDALPDDWVPTSSAILGTGAAGRSGTVSREDAAIRNVLIELHSRGARISGTVTSTAGHPLAGVFIRVVIRTAPDRDDDGGGPEPGTSAAPGIWATRPYGRSFTRVVTTDRSGSYEIRGLPPGSLAVAARIIGERPAVRRMQLLDGDTVTVDFTLQEPAVTTSPERVSPGPPPPPGP